MLKDDVNMSSVFADTQKLGRCRDCYESEREVVVRVTCVEQEEKKQFVYLLQFGYLGIRHLINTSKRLRLIFTDN